LDTLSGLENLTGSAFNDSLTGTNNANVLVGGSGNDTILGLSGNDTIDGGNGNDLITGGVGSDVLTGLRGADRVIYTAVNESTLAARDLIRDMTASDILDLAAIDANTGLAGDQAFVLAGALTGVAGQYTLAYNGGTNETLLQADTNGDGVADLAIAFTGNVTGMAGGWVL
jgi:Ca2+-binding RTX toxin-like protein